MQKNSQNFEYIKKTIYSTRKRAIENHRKTSMTPFLTDTLQHDYPPSFTYNPSFITPLPFNTILDKDISSIPLSDNPLFFSFETNGSISSFILNSPSHYQKNNTSTYPTYPSPPHTQDQQRENN